MRSVEQRLSGEKREEKSNHKKRISRARGSQAGRGEEYSCCAAAGLHATLLNMIQDLSELPAMLSVRSVCQCQIATKRNRSLEWIRGKQNGVRWLI